MKSRFPMDNRSHKREKNNGSELIEQKKMKKSRMRLGGGGLSLEAFSDAKTKGNHYNPALIRKQREFYKNAKYVRKYKKSLKQQGQPNGFHKRLLEAENEAGEVGVNQETRKGKRSGAQSLRELYQKKREEEEKERLEREALIQAKKEERERAMSRRKALREKMFKKTRSGQPVMKYRIENILQKLQGSQT